MASPVKAAKTHHQGRGFTEVAARGKGYLRSKKPGLEQYALTTQVGGIGWHFGAGPFDASHEVDTAWQATTGAWQWEMVLADFHVHARDTFNAGNLIEYRDPVSDEWVIFDPLSLNWVNQDNSRQQIAIKQAVTAVITDDLMEFPAGYGPGRHFSYECQTGRLKKVIAIDSAGDLPTPTVAGPDIWFESEFSLSTSSGVDIYLDGVLWTKQSGVRVTTGNRIEFRDSANTQVFWYLDFPRAWDSSGDNETIGEFEVRRQGGPSSLFITVRIPRAWVDAATFPIYIDPTIDDQVGGGDYDAFENWGGTGFTSSGSTINVSSNDHGSGVGENSGHIFTVDGPGSGDTIDTAYFEGYCAQASLDYWNIDTFGEAIDDSPSFVTNADLMGRTPTSATVSYVNADSGAPSWWGSSVELKTVIKEIIDRAGWASGQDLCLLVWGKDDSFHRLRFTAYDGDSSLAGKLHIEYTAGGAAAIGPFPTFRPVIS